MISRTTTPRTTSSASLAATVTGTVAGTAARVVPRSAGRRPGVGVRRRRPPRSVVVAWSLALVIGAVLLARTWPRPAPRTPGPGTLTAYLSGVTHAQHHDLRVDGLHGSGHAGSWQFLVHVTWRTPAGAIQGGTVQIPSESATALTADDALAASLGTLGTLLSLGGTPATESLVGDQSSGWTLAQLHRALVHLPAGGAPLGMVDLATSTGASTDPSAGTLVYCHGVAAEASCLSKNKTGQQTSSFTQPLSDDPLVASLSVEPAGRDQ